MSGLRSIGTLLALSMAIDLALGDRQVVYLTSGEHVPAPASRNDHETSTYSTGLLVVAPPATAKLGVRTARHDTSGNKSEKEETATSEAKELEKKPTTSTSSNDKEAEGKKGDAIEHVHPKVAAAHHFSNTITVPDNCPEGQKLVDNECRDIVEDTL